MLFRKIFFLLASFFHQLVRQEVSFFYQLQLGSFLLSVSLLRNQEGIFFVSKLGSKFFFVSQLVFLLVTKLVFQQVVRKFFFYVSLYGSSVFLLVSQEVGFFYQLIRKLVFLLISKEVSFLLVSWFGSQFFLLVNQEFFFVSYQEVSIFVC